ncbi:hypothetical protein J2R96_000102 [Bradyrhizobium elkanii]|nr:hypothetical protein [Bradyrhizobium elkanii]
MGVPARRNQNALGLDAPRSRPDRDAGAAFRNPQRGFVDDPGAGALRRDRLRADQTARADVSGIARLEIALHSRRRFQKRKALREPRIMIGFTPDPVFGTDPADRSNIGSFAAADVKRTGFPIELHAALR